MSIQTPPIDPILTPGSATDQDQKTKLTPKPGLRAVPISSKSSKPSRKMVPNPEPTYTLERAFSYEQACMGQGSHSMDMEKAVRACAYLLDWTSDAGNDDIDGPMALGIARALEHCANRIKKDREYEASANGNKSDQ
jgi:hypothetical protein